MPQPTLNTQLLSHFLCSLCDALKPQQNTSRERSLSSHVSLCDTPGRVLQAGLRLLQVLSAGQESRS